MPNISDIIEQYLKHILQKSAQGFVEIQRNDLADQFQCVPSQINYVISTRFTMEKGYLVESKRGGGGYIRIQRIDLGQHGPIHERIVNVINHEIDQSSAEGLIYQLEEAKVISAREARIIRAAVSRDVLPFKLPIRDEVRAKILKNMLISLLSQ